MSNRLTAAAAALAASTLLAAQPGLRAIGAEHPPGAASVRVVVTYTGKGTVDDSHRLWVWLFDTPNIGPGAMPIDQVSLAKNGGDAVFDAVAGTKVWIAAAYDESGTMAGDGPPPTGTPVGVLTSDTGEPMAVAPDQSSPVKLTFDDSVRMP